MLKILTIVDISSRSVQLPWPLHQQVSRSYPTVASLFKAASLIAAQSQVIDYLPISYEGNVLLPIALINQQLQWQADLSSEEMSQLTDLLIPIYGEVKQDEGLWQIKAGAKGDCVDFKLQQDMLLMQKIVEIELALYDAPINAERKLKGLPVIAGVREANKCQKHHVKQQVYTSRSDFKRIFNGQSIRDWMHQPVLDGTLIFDANDQTLQREQFEDMLLDLLETHKLFIVKIVHPQGVSYYSSTMGQHLLMRFKLFAAHYFESSQCS